MTQETELTETQSPPEPRTVAELHERYPKLAAHILQEGQDQGADAERERLLGLESVAMPGHEALLAAAKQDGTTTAADLAVQIIAAEKQRGQTQFKAMIAEAQSEPEITASQDPGTPTLAPIDLHAPIEERAEAEWPSNADLRAEFSSKESYVAYRKAEEQGRVKRYTKS